MSLFWCAFVASTLKVTLLYFMYWRTKCADTVPDSDTVPTGLPLWEGRWLAGHLFLRKDGRLFPDTDHLVYCPVGNWRELCSKANSVQCKNIGRFLNATESPTGSWSMNGPVRVRPQLASNKHSQCVYLCFVIFDDRVGSGCQSYYIWVGQITDQNSWPGSYSAVPPPPDCAVDVMWSGERKCAVLVSVLVLSPLDWTVEHLTFITQCTTQ